MTFNRARRPFGLRPGLSTAGSFKLERPRKSDLQPSDQGGTYQGLRVRAGRERMLAGAVIRGGGSAPFSPDDILGLEIWLDASNTDSVTTVDDSGTTRVSVWDSIASGGASRSFAQATMANRPEYQSGGEIYFDSARPDYLTLNESSGLDWSDGTFFLSYQKDVGVSTQYLFNISDSLTNRVIAVNSISNDSVVLQINSSITGQVTVDSGAGGNLRHLCVNWEDGVSVIGIDSDNNTQEDLSYSGPNLNYTKIELGRRGNNSAFYKGKLKELLFWQRRLSTDEINDVFSYLVAKA